jgi:hypothetical protein
MAARGGGAPAAGAKDATKDRCDACSWGCRSPECGAWVVAATVRGTGAVWARRTGPSALSLRPRDRNRRAGRTPPLQSPRLTVNRITRGSSYRTPNPNLVFPLPRSITVEFLDAFNGKKLSIEKSIEAVQ